MPRGRFRKDPTGMTSHAALKEARALFTEHPRLKSVYRDSVMALRVGECRGQAIIAGRKTTRGCGHHWHLQPCPGGPMVYTIVRGYSFFNVIEAQGDSWREALDQIVRRREEEAKRYAAKPEPTTRAKRKKGA